MNLLKRASTMVALTAKLNALSLSISEQAIRPDQSEQVTIQLDSASTKVDHCKNMVSKGLEEHEHQSAIGGILSQLFHYGLDESQTKMVGDCQHLLREIIGGDDAKVPLIERPELSREDKELLSWASRMVKILQWKDDELKPEDLPRTAKTAITGLLIREITNAKNKKKSASNNGHRVSQT